MRRLRLSWIRPVVLAGVTLLVVPFGWALTAVQEAKLTASDAEPNDTFGEAVALSGDTAVVGARWEDHAGVLSAGSAYVFVRSGPNWTEQAKLTASDAASRDFFGWSVALSGDAAVVGSPADQHSGGVPAGSVYVFKLIPGYGGDDEVPAVGGAGAVLTLLAVAGIGVYFMRRAAH